MEPAPRQLYALGFSAFTVPAVLLLPRVGWLWATAASAACALLLALLVTLRKTCCHGIAEIAGRSAFGRVCLVLALVWNLLLLGAAAKQLCAAFPTGNTFPLIGLLLLLLAVYAAQQGEEIILRVGAIVFFALLLFFALILGFSLPNLRMKWLTPVITVDWRSLTAVLCPTVALYLGGNTKGGKCFPWLLGGIAFAGLCALVSAGSLSPAVVAAEEFPFYTAAKSVSVLGAMERLEPLVSAALTAGGFCLLGMICAANGRIIAAFFPQAAKFTALLNFSVGSAAMWVSGLISATVTAAGTATFWGLFPLLTLSLGARKKFKNSQKKC